MIYAEKIVGPAEYIELAMNAMQKYLPHEEGVPIVGGGVKMEKRWGDVIRLHHHLWNSQNMRGGIYINAPTHMV